MTEAVHIGSRTEPFVDGFLIDRLQGARLKLHEPVRREVVFEANGPADCCTSAYYNLLQDGDRIRMYYRGYAPPGEGADLAKELTANLLESSDGIQFERPELGLFEFQGSRKNNIVWRGTESSNLHVFRDANPACKPNERYKAVGHDWETLYGLVSPDGLHWRRIQEEPLGVPGAFDSLNVAFWHSPAKCYRLFSRYFSGQFDKSEPAGIRCIQSCTSEDFIHWTKPVPHQYATGVPLEHFYTNATVPCPGAEHILLSFPKRFVPERTKKEIVGQTYPGEGVSDAVFMSSRDGVHWDRTFMDAWVRPGPDERNWTHRSNMPAVGIFETAPGEWSMYISEHYGWPTNRLRRLTLRRHGIASLQAGYRGGECLTRPVIFSGKELRLNYETSAVGSVQVELQDKDGEPVEGFALADMAPLFGDELDALISWKSGSDLSRLAGRPVRFRFVLKDAHVFALRTA